MKLSTLFICSSLALGARIGRAEINPDFQGKIQEACVVSGKLHKPVMKDLKSVCVCIAQTHLIAAHKEPKENEAIDQLNWVLSYYGAKDTFTQKKLIQDPKNIFEFDMQVTQDCLIAVRGK